MLGKGRTVWIICCGMRRSGSTLQYQLVKEIVECKNVGEGLGWIEPHQFHHLRTNHITEHKFLVIKCHRYIEEIKELYYKGEAKAIYSYRDVRDVVVSIMNKNKISFWQVLKSGFISLIMEEYTKWNTLNNILISQYEYMIEDLLQETRRIADYIEIELDEILASDIAKKFIIEHQSERIQSFNYDELGIKSGGSLYDPTSLLHNNHIHSGKPEQWKNVLSRLQAGWIENIAHDWLLEKNYSISQNWVVRKIALILYLSLNILQSSVNLAMKIIGP